MAGVAAEGAAVAMEMNEDGLGHHTRNLLDERLEVDVGLKHVALLNAKVRMGRINQFFTELFVLDKPEIIVVGALVGKELTAIAAMIERPFVQAASVGGALAASCFGERVISSFASTRRSARPGTLSPASPTRP